MDEVVKSLIIVMVLSLAVAVTSGVAVFSGAQQGTSPNTPLLLASLVLLVVDLWYLRRLFVSPEQLAGG